MCIQIYVHLWMQIYIHMCICIYIHIYIYVYTCAKSLQSCSILCNPMDCSPPDSSVHGVLQARVLECVAMLSSRGIASTQESNLYLMSLALTGIFFTTSTTWEVQYKHTYIHTYTHTRMYIYIYIYIERERERIYIVLLCLPLKTVHWYIPSVIFHLTF